MVAYRGVTLVKANESAVIRISSRSKCSLFAHRYPLAFSLSYSYKNLVSFERGLDHLIVLL